MDEKRSERIEDKLDQVASEVGHINIHIAEIKKDLKYHIKRTDLLQTQVTPMWKIFISASFLIAAAVFLASLAEIVGYFKK